MLKHFPKNAKIALIERNVNIKGSLRKARGG
jgi:hypothetical protein